jgi:starch phosphorylase
VQVQVVHGKVGPNRDLTQTRVENLSFIEEADGKFVFRGEAQADILGHQGYTIRVVPFHADIMVPHELQLVTWPS